MDTAYVAVIDTLTTYLEGLHESDTARLRTVFHPQARYISAAPGDHRQLDMAAYLAMVDERPSPASRGEPRRDRIVSIEFAGPEAAFARVTCAIGPKRFTDLLTLILEDGAWRIVSKVFHYDLVPEEDA